ncbi:MAG: RNA polymerase sigma factor [Clostridia bacterium]|nr:RNA polymerase sigma factor [Clostridia bacterium]
MSLSQVGKSDFEIMYDKYSGLLYRLALSHLQSAHDAEDAVHDVFAKYISTPHRFKDNVHEEAWFVKVTVNHCRDILRKKKHRNHLSLDEIHHLKTEEETENSGVLEVLGKLSERYKAVIVLHYLEGYSIDEISFMLGISVSAVKMRLSRGRDLLKNLMERED